MTSLPDWLVERVALDDVPPTSRDRVARADAGELARRVAELRAANAAELASHPAPAAVAQIEARVAAAKRVRRPRRRAAAWLALASVATVAAGVVVVTRPRSAAHDDGDPEITRVKGAARLVAYRQAGDHAEPLAEDSLVQAGDLVQLRYHAGGRRHGVIASLDGAGAVTLHFPAGEREPTELAPKSTTLAHAYALDDAPRFERFFFITANDPIDVPQSLAALRTLAQRADGATAALELPAGLHQWSLRLRKPDRSPLP